MEAQAAVEDDAIQRYRDHARALAGQIRIRWEHSGREDLKTLVDDVHAALVEEAAQELRQVLFQLSATLELSEVQRQSGRDGPSPELIERMKAAVSRASRVVDVYLDRNNAVQSVIPLNYEPFDLALTVGEVLRVNGFQNAPIPLHAELAPVTLNADRVRLMDVLTHLITRFFFAARGGTTLHVHIREQDGYAAGFIGLSPSPIETQVLVSEFNKPFAIDSMEMDTPYCRAVIERHGGAVYVAEEEGATGFGFTLPREPTEP